MVKKASSKKKAASPAAGKETAGSKAVKKTNVSKPAKKSSTKKTVVKKVKAAKGEPVKNNRSAERPAVNNEENEVMANERPAVSLQSGKKFWLYFLATGLVILIAVQSYGYLTGWGNPQKVIERHFNQAQRLTLAKRFDAAVKHYEKVIAMKSSSDETRRQAMVGMADLYREMKEWKKAIVMYDQLRSREANGVMSAWSGLKIAESQIEAGQANQALGTYQDIMNAYPASDWDAEARLGMGKAYEALKDYTKAIEVYRSLEKEYKGGFLAADALIQAGRCYEKMGDKKSAQQTYEHVIGKYPETMADEAKRRLRRLKSGKAPQGIRSWDD